MGICMTCIYSDHVHALQVLSGGWRPVAGDALRHPDAVTGSGEAVLSPASLATWAMRREFTLWDGALSGFGLRVQPSGSKSFLVQTRVRGRMRKFTLGRFPAMGIVEARKEAAAVLARIWAGEDMARTRRPRPPLLRDFAARYREQRAGVWKPATLETFDIYLRACPALVVFNTPCLVATGRAASSTLAMQLEAPPPADEPGVRARLDIIEIRDPDEARAIHARRNPRPPAPPDDDP